MLIPNSFLYTILSPLIFLNHSNDTQRGKYYKKNSIYFYFFLLEASISSLGFCSNKGMAL